MNSNCKFFALSILASSLLIGNAQANVIVTPLLEKNLPKDALEKFVKYQVVAAGELEQASLQLVDDKEFATELYSEGASYIKAHFSNVVLLEGDTLTISSPNGIESYSYTSEDIKDGGIWALSIDGDTAVVTLDNKSGQASAFVDQYYRGYDDSIIKEQEDILESLCGSTDYKDAVCYEDSHPNHYQASKAVAKLNMGGSICTAWRVGPNDNTMITNQHCIGNQATINRSEVQFNFQRSTCGGRSNTSSVKIAAEKGYLFSDSAATDITLFTIEDPEAAAPFGALELEYNSPSIGDEIYIAEHPSGIPKVIAIEDAESNTGKCKVDSTRFRGTNISYYCDTQGGSSGSPVLSAATHKVVGLHHYGGCPNSAATFDSILDNARDPETGLNIRDLLVRLGGPTPSETPTPTPTTTPTPTATPTPTPTPTATPVPTTTPTVTPVPPTPTVAPDPTSTPAPTSTPTATPDLGDNLDDLLNGGSLGHGLLIALIGLLGLRRRK